MRNGRQSILFTVLRSFSFKTFFLVAVLIIGWLMLNREKLLEFWQSYQMRNNELERVIKLEYERRQLDERRQLLEQTNLEAERQVREKYKMKKPGEKIVIIK